MEGLPGWDGKAGLWGGKQGEAASWGAAFIFHKEPKLSAGASGGLSNRNAIPLVPAWGLHWHAVPAGRKQGQVYPNCSAKGRQDSTWSKAWF